MKKIQKILIVDDNPFLISVIQEILEAERYEIRVAGDGRFGYLTYLEFKPDLVITDIRMPEKNGLELMKLIRIHNPEVKTIYMSCDLQVYALPLDEEKAHYCVSLLEKPFSRNQLLGLLAELVVCNS